MVCLDPDCAPSDGQGVTTLPVGCLPARWGRGREKTHSGVASRRAWSGGVGVVWCGVGGWGWGVGVGLESGLGSGSGSEVEE